MAENMMDDATVEVEDQDDFTNNRMPFNQDPPIIYEYLNQFVLLMTAYGWYMLIGVIVLYYAWVKFLPYLRDWRDRTEVQHKKYDASEIERRQLAIDAHRRKLQEEFDAKARAYAEKQAELEAKKREQKLEEWEKHQAGLGYRSKVKKAEEPQQATVIPKTKKKLRNEDYNPLMGADGPSCSWRPNRRGPASGGG